MKKSLKSVVAILFLCGTTIALADVYRWVDERGRVQFSDQPPPNANAQKVDAKPATGKGVSSETKTYKQQDQEFRKRRVEEEEVTKKRTDAEKQANIKQRNCANARAQLASLQAGGRVSRTNEKGEREVLDESGTQSAINDAKQAIAEWCQ